MQADLFPHTLTTAQARPMCPLWVVSEASLRLLVISPCFRFAKNKPLKTAVIATTIISSTKLNPDLERENFCFFAIIFVLSIP